MVSILKLEFDFYELDSWDYETFAVVINCVTISLGIFFWNIDEGTRQGTVGDVSFKTQSLGAPANVEFNAYSDQAHHVTINLPSRFVNGVLNVKFLSSLNGDASDESFGIDNIKITAYKCGV